MEKKKLVAKEIVWFSVFSLVALLIAGMPVRVFLWRGLILYKWGSNWNLKAGVITLTLLYLIRAIVVIKKQSKGNQ